MKEHLLIFWQRKLEDSYKENYDLQTENARLKAEVDRLTVEADWKTPARRNKALEAEVERLQAVINEARDYLGNCTTLETPGKNAYALVWLNSKNPKP